MDSRRSRISTDNTMVIGLERDPISPLISSDTLPDSDDEYEQKKLSDGDGNEIDEGDDSSYGTAEIMVPEKDLDQDDGYESAQSPTNRSIIREEDDAIGLNEAAAEGLENQEPIAIVKTQGSSNGEFQTPTVYNRDPFYLPTLSHALVLDSMRESKKKLRLFDTYKRIVNGSKHKNTNTYSFTKSLTMRIRKPTSRRPTKGAVGSILSTIGGESELPEELENRELYYNEVTWLLAGNGRW